MKRIGIALITLILIFSLSITVFAGYLGDVNNDDKITASDARSILRHAVELELLSGDMLKKADIDNDGEITAGDARLALRMSAKLDDLIEDHEHIYSSTEIQLQSCEKDGIVEYECAICSHKYQDEIKATGHNYVYYSTTEPTCKKEGMHIYKCEKCGAERTTIIEKTAHTMGDAVVTLESTCQYEGNIAATCIVCGYTESQDIAKKDHSWLDATCTEAKKCSYCGTTDGSVLGHDWYLEEVTLMPTYTEKGECFCRCSRCNAEDTLAYIGPLVETSGDITDEMLRLINDEREKAGVEPLEYYEGAQIAVDARAQELQILFSHTRPNGYMCYSVLNDYNIGSGFTLGENIAWGYGSVEAVMEGWMNSPGHRANILNPNYTHIAIGEYEYGWVQMFFG